MARRKADRAAVRGREPAGKSAEPAKTAARAPRRDPATAARSLARQVGEEKAQRATAQSGEAREVRRKEMPAGRPAALPESESGIRPAAEDDSAIRRAAKDDDSTIRRAAKDDDPTIRRAAKDDDSTIRRAAKDDDPTIRRAASAAPEDRVQRAAAADEVQRAADGPDADLRRAAADPSADERTAARAAAGAAPTVTADVERRLDQEEGRGESLDPGVRGAMENRLGTDLSGVRVHTDGEAGALAKRLEAKAFTTGQDVYFAEGQYDPGSRAGQQLLAHELVHTVQQKRGGSEGPRRAARATTVSQPGEPAEREAEAIAQRVTEGAGAEQPRARDASVQRAPATPAGPEPAAASPGAAADEGAFRLQLPGGAVSFSLQDQTGEVEFDLAPYAERIPGLRLGVLKLRVGRNGRVRGASISAGVSVPFVTGDVSIAVDGTGAIGRARGDLTVEVPHFATGRLDWSYEAGALSGSLTVGARQIQVPGLPLKDSSLTIRVTAGVLSVDGHATTGDAVPGLSEGRLTVAYDGQRKAFAIAVGARVDVPGLDAAAFDVAMDADGNWKGSADVSAGFSGASGSVHLEHENWVLKEAEGSVGYSRGPLAGTLAVRLSPPAGGAPGELAIGGEGDLAVQVAPWLKGTGHAVLYPDGNVDLSGALTFPSEVELFKERKFEKTLFQMDQEFPLWGVTIPVAGSIGLIAEIHAKLGVRTRFGPAVLRDILVEGTYSTRDGTKAPEAGGAAASGGDDPAAAPEPSFAVSGEFFVPAGAELVVIVGGGVGLSALVAKLTGGVDLVGTAGAYSTLSVRPRFQYQDGKYSFKGVAELQAALVASLGVNAYAAAEVGIGWLSKEVWRKDWNLASFTWDPGVSLGMKAGLDYTLGESFEPRFDVQPIEIDPRRLVKSAMPESGQPTPDKPRGEPPRATLRLDPAPEAVSAAPAPAPADAGRIPGVPAAPRPAGGGGRGAPPAPSAAPGAAGPAAQGRGQVAVPGEARDPAPFIPERPSALDKVPEERTEDEAWDVLTWDRFTDQLEERTGRTISRVSEHEKTKRREAERLDIRESWKLYHDPSRNKMTYDDFKAHAMKFYWDHRNNVWRKRKYELHEGYKVPGWPLFLPRTKAGTSKKAVWHDETRGDAKDKWTTILARYRALARNKRLWVFPRHPREDVDAVWERAYHAGDVRVNTGGTYQVDHIVELQLGGDNALQNLQLLDQPDNGSAGPTIQKQISHDARELTSEKFRYDRVTESENVRDKEIADAKSGAP